MFLLLLLVEMEEFLCRLADGAVLDNAVLLADVKPHLIFVAQHLHHYSVQRIVIVEKW